MPHYFNRASSLTGLRDVATKGGFDLPAVMRSLGLPGDLLRKPDEKVEFGALCALFERCAAEWDMPDLGLRVAPYQHLDVLGPIALVTRMERDLRTAINAMTQNLVIHSNAIDAVLEETGDVAALILNVQDMPAGIHQYTLLMAGVVRNVIEQAGNAPVDLIEVSFRQGDGDAPLAAASYFHCPIRYGAERNALYFDRAVLNRPMERSDSSYHAIISRYLKTSRQEIAGRTSDTVVSEIARQMEFGACTLETVSQSMRLEPRTLQRRLKQEGASFSTLVDDWRRGRALSLITHTRLPLSEVSLAIGYSDQSTFSRAFQRWYGVTPLAYRHKDAAGIPHRAQEPVMTTPPQAAEIRGRMIRETGLSEASP